MSHSDDILEKLLDLFPLLRAEGILGLTILIVTLISFRRKTSYPWPQYVAIAGILASAVLQIGLQQNFLNDWFRINGLSLYWRIVLDVSLVLILTFDVNRHLRTRASEYVIISLMVLLGAHFLIIANHLFMVYLSIEVMSLSAYLLVALSLFKRQINSGFKYLVFGAVASAMMLYGISLFYGLEGDLTFQGFDASENSWVNTPHGWAVLLLITFGLLFKTAAFPFHIWVNDVYRAASIPVLAIFSVLPKLAAMLFLVRWTFMLPDSAEIVAAIAMITIAIGNFGALRQTNVRGILGMSSVAHTGFMLTGLLLIPSDINFLYFYMAVYAVMTVGTFHALNFYELHYGVEGITDFAGMSELSTWKTIKIVIWMVALTGLPPTAGFTAKLFLFSGLANQYSASGELVILAVLIFAVVNAVVSLAYYLKIPYQMIFKKPDIPFNRPNKIFTTENFLGTILVLAILLLFIKPEWLMGWINSVSFVP